MGGGRKLKDSARPQSAILSGEQGGGGDGAGSFDETELPVLEEAHLAVNLVMLNPQVHALTKVDDSVSVGKDGAVTTKHGRLGNIPPGYRQTVTEQNLKTGIVASLSIVPVGATVLLSAGQ